MSRLMLRIGSYIYWTSCGNAGLKLFVLYLLILLKPYRQNLTSPILVFTYYFARYSSELDEVAFSHSRNLLVIPTSRITFLLPALNATRITLPNGSLPYS